MYETHEMAYFPGIELRVVRSRVVLQNLLCKHSDEFPPASLRNIKVNTEKLCHSVQKETTTGEDFRNGASRYLSKIHVELLLCSSNPQVMKSNAQSCALSTLVHVHSDMVVTEAILLLTDPSS